MISNIMAHTAETRRRALAKMTRLREEWLAQNGPCMKCGGRHDLHVHHRDHRTKVSHRVWSWRADRRAVELAKCEVMCRACHVLTHSLLSRKPHGIGAYRRGCRCEVCRAARAAQCRRYRDRNRNAIRAGKERYKAANSYRDKWVVIHDEPAAQAKVSAPDQS